MNVSAKEEFDKEVERLVSFLHKSFKARVKWSRTGKWQQVIQCEMGIALSMGRLDLVSNLLERHNQLGFLSSRMEQIEYEERFASADGLPTEIVETDSTLSLLETEKGFAEVPKE